MPSFTSLGARAATTVSRRMVLVALLTATVVVGAPSPAFALPAVTPQTTAGADDQVWAVVQVGGTIYIGGEFTTVGGEPRNRLAAIDASSGNVTSWNPNASGPVYALAAGDDGSIYAGGKFGFVGGLTRKNVAKIDGNGAVVASWNPKATQGVVRAVAVGNSRVYLGGTFLKLNAAIRNRLGAVDEATAALDAWNPGADDVVRGLDIGSGGSVYAGGYFDNAGGAARANVVQLDPSTGSATGFNAAISYPLNALSVVGGTVYFAGAGGGGTVGAHDASSGARLWSFETNGDVDGIDASGSTVYAGGHFDNIKDGNNTPRRHLAAFSASNGALQPWIPKPNGPFGVAVVVVTDDAVLIGGGFTKVNGVTQPKFARLPGTP